MEVSSLTWEEAQLEWVMLEESICQISINISQQETMLIDHLATELALNPPNRMVK
jgi:hypothetical protein